MPIYIQLSCKLKKLPLYLRNMKSKKRFKVLLIFLSIGCLVSMYAQTAAKLPATTIMGTGISVDYSTNTASTTVNTIANAFDGNLNTYFASYERSGTWVGLDLGERHIITKIAYAPRYQDYAEGPKRLVLGIFEGANNPDFSDAVPLLMITEAPQGNVLTERTVNCSKGFRYVRYVGPNDMRCNIAEIEFYGYKGAGNNSRFPQLTNLPTVTIHTVNNKPVTSRDNYVQGTISIINNGTLFSDNLDIKGRGHGSWSFPKKPYRIKLNNKVNLLGSPAKERNWVLVNNYGDKTLMRNLLAFDLSRRFDMAYTAVGVSVDVILNGEYQGNYQLCDHIEVAVGRVDIQKTNPYEITLPNLSGGYLLEVDAYAYDEVSKFISARKYTPVKIKYPKDDEIVIQQSNYIRDHYNKMETALFATNYKDPVNGYRKYLDVESFIRHFLIGEITGNTDTYWSVYMYKNRNDDIFKFGPAWDFDLGYQNDTRTYPINTYPEWVYEQKGSVANGFRDVVNRLLTDESFVSRLKAVYADYRNRGIITKEALLQVADNYASELYQSQQLNFMRWNILNTRVHMNPRTYGSYEGEVNNVKKYISDRLDWMDKKLGYVPMLNTLDAPTLSNIAVYAQANAICFGNVTGNVHITIVDIAGRVILSKTIKDNTSVAVPKGVYIITVSDAKEGTKTVKCLVG
jgi:hypothetical protein